MTEQRDNSFVLFKNKTKQNPKGPDWSGHATVNGQSMFIDAWEKDGGRGMFLSGSLKNKNQHTQKEPERQQMGGNIGPDDDIPFAPCF